jgi:hypothetical protein
MARAVNRKSANKEMKIPKTTYEAEAQAVTTDVIIKKVFNAVPVP